jgi:hypothetical protein
LARKIIEVVDAQNAGNRKHDLPELELGLGIAFSDEPPAFLYDGEQQIMISPAINRASELSNCSASLKHSSLRSSENPRGVEVVAPADDKLLQKGEEGLLRYNVNGIELDAAAFHKLKNEISLRTVEITLPGHGVPTRFHAGRYPDRKGAMHWIIVREAPVRIWIGNNLGTEERGGRRFYEVVANVGVLSNVQRHLKRGVASSLQPKPREMRADSGDQTRLLH